MKSLAALLLSTTCGHAFTCQQAWNYAYCAYPPLVVSAFPGQTAGDQIAACVTSLPPTGGVCDARDLPSGGTIPGMTISQSGAVILGPCGQFTVTGQILYQAPGGLNGLRWTGCGGSAGFGNNGTQLIWAGTAATMFRVVGVRDSTWEQMQIKYGGSTQLANVFQLETQTGASATARHFRDININGGNGQITDGFFYCTGDTCGSGGAGGDNNNDQDEYDNVSIASYSNSAWHITGGQSKAHLFTRTTCTGNNVGRYCIDGEDGSYTAINMAGGGNTVTDFYQNSADDAVVIIRPDLEGSARLLLTGGSASPWPITFIGGRWGATNLNADNNVVVYSHRGGLNLIGLIVDSPAIGATPMFALNPGGGGPVRGFAAGNATFWGTATAASQPYTSTVPGSWTLSANVVTDSKADINVVPDAIAGAASCSGAPTANFSVQNGVIVAC
jgi:hypothetical protein